MVRRLALLLAALSFSLLGATAASPTRLKAPADDKQVQSRFGLLAVKGDEPDEARLTLNGRQVLKLSDFEQSADYLQIKAAAQVGSHDIFVIAGVCCEACGATFIVLDVGGPDDVRRSKSFGTCREDPIITQDGDVIRVDMPEFDASYRTHRPRYYTLKRWRYVDGRLQKEETAGHVSPTEIGEEIDWAGFKSDEAQVAAERKLVRKSPAPASIPSGQVSWAKVLVRNAADGWASRGFFDVFAHVPAGEWRTVRREDQVVGVVGVSRDGRAAFAAINGQGCGSDCASGPDFMLMLRQPPAPTRECKDDLKLKTAIDGREVDFSFLNTFRGFGAAVERSEGLMLAPNKVSFRSMPPDEDWSCYDWELGCLEGSPLLRLKAGKQVLRVQNTSCAGDQQPYDFDLSGAPFSAVPEWRPG